MQFRKDINGLRAVAVVAVVLFHFYPSLVSGGFAGVDVFFVISGYLMTGIIFRGIEKEKFSILDFYASRANRIIPPLVILCITMLILGYFFLASWDYKTIGRDVSTSLFFVSSIIFSLRSGYFDTGDNFLLHTWSLSSEWQFYIIYPLIILGMRKYMSIKNMKVAVLFGTILAFIFSVIATYKWPTASYFLLPMRAWEMMIGGVAFLYPIFLQEQRKKSVELVGLTLIFSSYLLISKDNFWPGYLAIFPVLGSFLIIQAQRNDSFILGNVLAQKLGAYSYSIYLWHWPIAVSFSYFSINDNFKVIGVILSLFLGLLSYKLIESKVSKTFFSSKIIINHVLVIMPLGMVGVFIYMEQGLPQREDLVSNSLIHGGTMDDYMIHEGVSLINTENEYDYLLIGDSNSNHYVRGIIKDGTRVKNAWYSNCLSFPNSMSVRNGVYPTWKKNCGNNYKLGIMEEKSIIISESWNKPKKDSLECKNENCKLTNNYYVDLKYQLKELLEVYGGDKNIYIIGELPKPRNNEISKCLKTNALLGTNLSCDRNGKSIALVNEINLILSDVASKYKNVFFIDPVKFICKNDLCEYNKDNKSIFMTDGDHLSAYGSEVIWKYIIDSIEVDS